MADVQHAGVVDDDIDVGGDPGRGRDAGGVVEVDMQRNDAVTVGRGQGIERFGAARGRVDPARAGVEKRLDDALADAAVGAGDENDAIFD